MTLSLIIVISVAEPDVAQNSQEKANFGTPFVKGKSGNPSGRPKGIMQYVRAQTEDGKELVDIALEIARGTLVIKETYFNKEGEPNEVEREPNFKDRMGAITWLGDRGFGKAVETVQVQNPDGSAFRQTLVIALSQAITSGQVLLPPDNQSAPKAIVDASSPIVRDVQLVPIDDSKPVEVKPPSNNVSNGQ